MPSRSKQVARDKAIAEGTYLSEKAKTSESFHVQLSSNSVNIVSEVEHQLDAQFLAKLTEPSEEDKELIEEMEDTPTELIHDLRARSRRPPGPLGVLRRRDRAPSVSELDESEIPSPPSSPVSRWSTTDPAEFVNRTNSIVHWLHQGHVYDNLIDLAHAREQSDLFQISRTESGNYVYRGTTYRSIEEVYEHKMSDMRRDKPNLGQIEDRQHRFPASEWTFQGIRYPSFAAMLRAKAQTWATRVQPNVRITPPQSPTGLPRGSQSLDDSTSGSFFPPIAKAPKTSGNGVPTDKPGPSSSTSGFRKIVTSQPSTTPKPASVEEVDLVSSDSDIEEIDSGRGSARDIPFEELPVAYQEAIEISEREIADDDFNTEEFTHAEQAVQQERYLRERAQLAAAAAERRGQSAPNPLYADIRERTDKNAKQKNRMRYRIKQQYFKSLGQEPSGDSKGETGEQLLEKFKQWMAEKPGIRAKGHKSEDDSSAAISEQLYIWDAEVEEVKDTCKTLDRLIFSDSQDPKEDAVASSRAEKLASTYGIPFRKLNLRKWNDEIETREVEIWQITDHELVEGMHDKHKFYTYKRVSSRTGEGTTEYAPSQGYRYGIFPGGHIELIWAEPDKPGNPRFGREPEEGYFFSQHQVDYIVVYRALHLFQCRTSLGT